MIRYIATLAIAVCASFAQADGIDFGKVRDVGLHIGSQHFPAKDHNNVNPGAYVRTDRDWIAGGYWNSERRMSWYAGRDFHLIGPFTLRAALITGYRRAPVLPMLALGVDVGYGFKLAFVPPVDKSAAVLHLAYEFEL